MVRPPCCDKSAGLKKGPWTPEEDLILVTFIQEHGPANWRAVPTNTGLRRCSKSCRLRWTNYLRPGIKRGNFTDNEEKMIIHLQALLGNRWAAIASYLPQRTDNDIKNFWNTHLKKKLNKLQQGPQQSESRDGSSSSPSSSSSALSNSNLSRGQWERRLQTDIHTARQALYDALSPEKPINNNTSSCASSSSEWKPSGSVSGFLDSQARPMSYASSTENIAKLLKGWVKNSPKIASAKGHCSSNDAAFVSHDVKEEIRNKENEFSGAFQPLFEFEYSISEISQAVSHETSSLFRDETKPDIGCSQKQLSMFEKWLFEDSWAQLGDVLSDEIANFF